MDQRLPTDPSRRRLAIVTAVLVTAAVAILAFTVASGRVALVSLYTAELALMIAVVAWLGLVRPLRAKRTP